MLMIEITLLNICHIERTCLSRVNIIILIYQFIFLKKVMLNIKIDSKTYYLLNKKVFLKIKL